MMNENEKSGDEILEYMRRHGVFDKDASGILAQKKKSKSRDRYRRFATHRAILDLHGLKYDEAVVRIHAAFEDCNAKGIRELLIIHGQGFHSSPQEGPVLKKLVLDMIENEFRSVVKDFRTAVPKDGGEGATVVWLR